MKPRNFPARKLLRAANAQGRRLTSAQLEGARQTRTKKDRRDRAKVRAA